MTLSTLDRVLAELENIEQRARLIAVERQRLDDRERENNRRREVYYRWLADLKEKA